MKKALLAVAAFALSSGAMAAPFVYPASWSATPASDAKMGGQFRDSQFGNFLTVNPFYTRVSGDLRGKLSAGSFLTLDIKTRDYIPYMAESYSLSKDKKTYTFNIRKGMKWSDGEEITADDWVIVAKINKDETMETEFYDTFFIDDKPINITKVDKYTVKVALPKATADGIEQVQFAPQPDHIFAPLYAKGKKALEAAWTLAAKPEEVVTGGAWTFVSYRAGERVTLGKNKYYGEWNVDTAGNRLPYMDGYTITIAKDGNAEFAQYLAGNTDEITPRNADDLAQIKRAIDGGNLKAVLAPNLSSAQTGDRIAFNWNRKSDPWKQKIFRSADFRRAMSHLMNRAAMVELAVGGLGSPMWSEVPPLFKQWQSPNLSKFEFNPEGAAALLAKIGFKKKNNDKYLVDGTGRQLEFDISPNTGNNRRATLCKIFQDEAKKIGVKVNCVPVDVGTWGSYIGDTAKSDDRKFDAVMYGIIGGGIIFPFSDYTIDYRNGGGMGYNNSGKSIAPFETQVLATYQRGLVEFDNAKRRQLGFDIQNIQSSNQAVVFLISPSFHGSWTNRVKGEYPRDLQDQYVGTRVLETTWIDEK